MQQSVDLVEMKKEVEPKREFSQFVNLGIAGIQEVKDQNFGELTTPNWLRIRQ
jgi:hypothetical protein